MIGEEYWRVGVEGDGGFWRWGESELLGCGVTLRKLYCIAYCVLKKLIVILSL